VLARDLAEIVFRLQIVGDLLHDVLGHAAEGLVLEVEDRAAAGFDAGGPEKGGDRTRMVVGRLGDDSTEIERLFAEAKVPSRDRRYERDFVPLLQLVIRARVGLIDRIEESRRLVAEAELRPDVRDARAVGQVELALAGARVLTEPGEQPHDDAHVAKPSRRYAAVVSASGTASSTGAPIPITWGPPGANGSSNTAMLLEPAKNPRTRRTPSPTFRTPCRACSGRWRHQHPFPSVESLDLGAVLTAVYAWYEQVEDALVLFARDADRYPEIWTERARRFEALADALARPLGRRRVVRAAVGYALAFDTWRFLVRREGLTNRQAVDAMVAFVQGV